MRGTPAYLVDHQVQGSPVTPAAAYVEQGLAAADQVFGPGRHGVANLVIQQAMFLPEGMRRRVQFSVAPESGGEATFETYSRPADAEKSAAAPWTMHATGSLVHESHGGGTRRSAVDLDAVRKQVLSVTSHEDFYEFMAERSLVYGPAFHVLDDLHRGEQEAAIEVGCRNRWSARRRGIICIRRWATRCCNRWRAPCRSRRTARSARSRTCRSAFAACASLRPIEDYSQPLFTYTRPHVERFGPEPGTRRGERLSGECGRAKCWWRWKASRCSDSAVAAAATRRCDTSRWLYRIEWQPSEIALQ